MIRQDEAYKAGMARLYRALLNLETAQECRAFLEDLCTFKEVEEMARRLEVAELLEEGRNYQEIAKRIDVSTATISRVNRALRYGSGGYETVLERLKAREENHADQ